MDRAHRHNGNEFGRTFAPACRAPFHILESRAMKVQPRLFTRAFGTIAMLLAGLGVAVAASPVCSQLEAQLSQFSRTQSPGAYQQFADAANQQRNELARAQAAAQQAGCSGGFLFFRPQQSPNCGNLTATVDRMQANLARLEQSRDQYAYSNGATSPARMRVLQSLGDYQCGPQYAPYASSRQGFFGIFGGPGYPPPNYNDNFNGGVPGFGGGTYRTLCVRSCDGYYFPISFSTSSARFPTDQAVCQSMCPGADVALYVHQNPGQESEDMVSLAGASYASQPFAFLYRQSYNQSCTCRATGAGATAAGGSFTPVPRTVVVAGGPTSDDVVVPIPLRKPNLSADPETIANTAGDFTPALVKPRTTGAAVAAISSPGQGVRQVGPSYYYAK